MTVPQDPQFTKDDKLLKPENYREWIYLSTGLGMVYGPARESTASANPPFENVFVNPKAYKTFLETGKWPTGTTFVLEIRASETQGSINGTPQSRKRQCREWQRKRPLTAALRGAAG